MKRQSTKVALCGIISSVSVVLMFMTGLFPFLTYTLPAVSGALLSILVIEINKKWATGAYVAISLLSILIVADKEAAMFFVAFFGYYPIIKEVIEKKFSRFFEWVTKLLLFNFAVVVAYAVIIYVFGIPFDELEEYGKYSALILLAMGNVIFLLYDYCMTSLITLYYKKWQKRFHSLFK